MLSWAGPHHEAAKRLPEAPEAPEAQQHSDGGHWQGHMRAESCPPKATSAQDLLRVTALPLRLYGTAVGMDAMAISSPKLDPNRCAHSSAS